QNFIALREYLRDDRLRIGELHCVQRLGVVIDVAGAQAVELERGELRGPLGGGFEPERELAQHIRLTRGEQRLVEPLRMQPIECGEREVARFDRRFRTSERGHLAGTRQVESIEARARSVAESLTN